MSTFDITSKKCKSYIDKYSEYLKCPIDESSALDNIYFENTSEKINYEQKIEKIDEQYVPLFNSLPLGLKIIYSSIGCYKEAVLNDFCFLSLKIINENKNNFNNFIDIAIRNAGMGHVLLLSLHKTSNKLFFRSDGGSNGFDIDYYYNKYSNYDPINNSDSKAKPFINQAKLDDSYLEENSHFIFHDIVIHKLMEYDTVLNMMIDSEQGVL